MSTSVTKSEPALINGGVSALVGAVLGLLVSFGLSLSADQTAAIMTFALVVSPLVQGYVTRLQVFSPKTHEETVDALVGTPSVDPDVTFVGDEAPQEGDLSRMSIEAFEARALAERNTRAARGEDPQPFA